MIEIYAGATAKKVIAEQGFHGDLFSHFLGASGGPKWFTLFGLDKYLFAEFFKHRSRPLNMLGSSAGAFRAACFGQNDPLRAIECLATHYSQTVYSADAKPAEITQKARALLDLVFGDHGVQEIIDNPVFKAHFIVAKSNGLVASENKLIQGAGLVSGYLRNRINRRLLKPQFERYIYQPKDSTLDLVDPCGFKTKKVSLSEDNLKDALLASGSIPLVMQGIGNIAGSPRGMYRDGGIIDYHFDFKLRGEGLTLYPHFNNNPKAGWFDKGLSRKVSAQNYDKTVMICPSAKFIASLPYQKIPDRTDFTKMTATTRIKYWQQVLADTEKMADAFDRYLANPGSVELKLIR